MPPSAVAETGGAWGWIAVVLLVAGLALGVYWSLIVRWVLVAIAAWIVIGTFIGERHSRRLKRERASESICTFARTLPARHHDTWVVRATYETLSGIVRVPIRPTDDLEKDLSIDPDDLDDAAVEIARRAGRRMEAPAANPFYGRVKMVADVIAFMENQPKKVLKQ